MDKTTIATILQRQMDGIRTGADASILIARKGGTIVASLQGTPAQLQRLAEAGLSGSTIENAHLHYQCQVISDPGDEQDSISAPAASIFTSNT